MVEQAPDSLSADTRLAETARELRRAGRFQAALDETTPAIEAGTVDAGVKLQHGLALVDAGALQPATDILETLIEAAPEAVPDQILAEAAAFGWHAPYRLGQTERAGRWIERALAVRPDDPDALEQSAVFKFYQNDYEGAFSAFHAVHALRPLSTYAVVVLRLLCRYLAVWGMLDQLDEIVRRHVTGIAESGSGTILEGATLALLATDDEAHLAVIGDQLASKYLGLVDQNADTASIKPPRTEAKGLDPNRRLTIGYILAHRANHPVLDLIRDMFRHHNRDDFEVVGLMVGDAGEQLPNFDTSTQFDRVVQLTSDSPSGLADQIAAIGLDIVIDFDGFAHENPVMPALALQPAPVTVTWLGYPGPIPGRLVNYQVVDPVIVPASARPHYKAALAYMPTTYKVLNSHQAVTGETTRPFNNNQLVFGCFCSIAKIQPELFDEWMRILAAVPSSVLWLQSAYPMAERNLKAAAEKAGIDPSRVVFAERMASKADHLGRLRHVDIGLDTWRYGGHVSTIDMLMAGVPVIAKQGTHFASRASQSILAAAGLQSLITDSAAGYGDLAISLAHNHDQLAAVEAQVQSARESSALFDPKGRIGELEQLYRAMWQRHCSGEAPTDIHLADDI